MNKKLITFVGIAAAVFILNKIFYLSSYFSEAEQLYFLRALVQENFVLAALIYLAGTTAGSVLLALPGVTFAILAGIIFDPLTGTLLCAAAATLAAGSSFLAGRFFLKESLKPLVLKNKHLKKWLFDDKDKNETLILMITRLVPLFPFNLQNFAYGITDISFRKYLTLSFLFMLPGTAMYTAATSGVLDPESRFLYLGIAGVLALFLFPIGYLLQKRYLQTEQESSCISCGRCMEVCRFLKKYKLDFSNKKALNPLAYHCFLCGRCTEVCPHGIDGKSLMLELRRERAAQFIGRIPGYCMLQLEKCNYLFRSYKHGNQKSVLFPGCSYPSFYPSTTSKLIRLMEAHAIGVIFDCCGKPIAELGRKEKEATIVKALIRRLKQHGIEEIIVLCPNCYDHLSGRLEIHMISIYEKLAQLGLGSPIAGEGLTVHLPCPDRPQGQWLSFVSHYLQGNLLPIEKVQCCGLGGCAAGKDLDITEDIMAQVKADLSSRNTDQLYVYCASCAGNFTRGRVGNVRHVLNEILESKEPADIRDSLANRINSKRF